MPPRHYNCTKFIADGRKGEGGEVGGEGWGWGGGGRGREKRTQTLGWIDRPTDRSTDGQIHRQIDRQIDKNR